MPILNLFSGNTKKDTNAIKETTSDGDTFVGYKFWTNGKFNEKKLPGNIPNEVDFTKKPPDCDIYVGTLTKKDGSIFTGSVEVRGKQYTPREGVTRYPGGKFVFRELVKKEIAYEPEEETLQVENPEQVPKTSFGFSSKKNTNVPLKVGQWVSEKIPGGKFEGYIYSMGDGNPKNAMYIGVINRDIDGERPSWKSRKHDTFVGLVRCVISDNLEYGKIYNKYYVDDGYGKFIKVYGVCIEKTSSEMFFGKYNFSPIGPNGDYPGSDNTEMYDGVHYDYKDYGIKASVINRGAFTFNKLVKGVTQGPYNENKDGAYCEAMVYNEEDFEFGHTFHVSDEGIRTKKPEYEQEVPVQEQGGRKTRRKRYKKRVSTRRRRRRRY
jgi:hypothetical protein